MRKIGYARISKDDQNTDLQLDALQAAGCVTIYTDEVTAVGRYRPGFDKALNSLKAGDTFVVWKLDRAFRSTVDAVTIWNRLCACNVKLLISTFGYVSDTPEGRYFYRGIASAAEFERDMISARTKEGMAAAIRRGHHVGRPAKVSLSDLRKAKLKLDRGSKPADIAKSLRMSEKVLFNRLLEASGDQRIDASRLARDAGS